jgi:hypothetical protein
MMLSASAALKKEHAFTWELSGVGVLTGAEEGVSVAPPEFAGALLHAISRATMQRLALKTEVRNNFIVFFSW